MKKKLMTMLAVTGVIGTVCVASHIAKPNAVYATSVDNEGYDILEEWVDEDDGTDGNPNDSESQNDGNASESDMTASTDYQSSTNSSTAGRPHLLDSTPKTADQHIEPMYAFSGGLFFLGLSLIFLDKRRRN